MAAPLTLGTAGHIDHGKTTLIGRLTGAQTDRLPEERARGISIELGYAQLTLPSGRRLSVVDAPGHERFVRTMVAGATGIDLYLMVVAADDGVMPQTREHAAVLRALGVDSGVVAITKTDLADPSEAATESSELFPGAQIVPISARTGEGIDELLAALEGVAGTVPSRAETGGEPRLHVDRVFTIRGAGTVVTGTLWSGSVGRGDEVRLLPSGRRARVRGVQVHDEMLDRAQAGQRVAVNLTGLAVDEVDRGEVLASAGSDLAPTFLVDAELGFEAREPEHGTRVQVHHGTRETAARLAWLGGDFWQLRLEAPLVPAPGDRLVVRQIAPPDTIGGGVVLDPRPKKHGPSTELLVRLKALGAGEAAVPDGDRLRKPRVSGFAPDDRRAARSERRPPDPVPPSALAAGDRLRHAGHEPPLDDEFDPADLLALRDAGRAVRVARNLHYDAGVIAEIRSKVIDLAGRHGGAITIAQLRDELGTSRKFAQALLEYFDSQKLTIRRGDEHVLRRTGPG